jgi:post-segregation antitoxin (ccd killing protein)
MPVFIRPQRVIVEEPGAGHGLAEIHGWQNNYPWSGIVTRVLSDSTRVLEARVDITIYLPDELGSWAKDNDINLSRMLRDEVEAERERRRAAAELLDAATVYELPVERDGRTYAVRLHGRQLGKSSRWRGEIYFGEDKQLYLYDGERKRLDAIKDPPFAELRRVLDNDDDYIDAMTALGEKAVIDVGRGKGTRW